MHTRTKELKDFLQRVYKGETDLLKEVYAEDLVDIAIDWFKHYQGDEDPNKMVELYSNLIDEESQETREAWIKKDIVELLDGVVDIIWVTLGYIYFGWLAKGENEKVTEEKLKENMIMHLVLKSQSMYIPFDLFKLAFIEIAYSNFTKSLEKQSDGEKAGKIIKGKNYKKPNLKIVFKLFNKQ